MTDHPDLETLSAVLDGEPAPPHVARCGACRERLAQLRRARDAVAQAVAPPQAGVRDAAVAHAVGSVAPRAAGSVAPRAAGSVAPRAAGSVAPRAAGSVAPPAAGSVAPPAAGSVASRRAWWLGASAAAVLVLVVGALALVGLLGRSGPDTTAATRGPVDNAPAPPAADTATATAELGDVDSLQTLRARLDAARSPAASPGTAPAGGDRAAPSSAEAAAAPVPRQVGTRVCEVEARTARPQLGPVAFAANLRFQGTPAVVLTFTPPAGGPAETLMVLAPQQGCRILAETTLP